MQALLYYVRKVFKREKCLMSLLKPREKDKKQDRSHLLPLLLLSRFSCCCYYCFYCCCWKSVAGAGSRKSAALRWKHAGKQPPAARENSIGGCTWFVLAVVFVVVVVAAVVHKFSSLTRSPLLSAGVGGYLPLESIVKHDCQTDPVTE